MQWEIEDEYCDFVYTTPEKKILILSSCIFQTIADDLLCTKKNEITAERV